MTSSNRLDVVVFDVVGTLADLSVVRRRLTDAGGDDLDAWFTHMLRDAMAVTLAGGYRPFADVAASTLHAHSRGRLSDNEIGHIVDGFSETTAHSDAIAALDAAVEAGCRVFTLSNGSIDSTVGFLERAGVRDRVEKVLSIDQVRAWKPAAAPYELAVAEAGVAVSRVGLVAVHAWDVHGAKRAGLTTGWCAREESVPTPAFEQADAVADTLDGVVRLLTE